MTLPDRAHAKSWEGWDVVDRDGERLGTCVGVFADTDTGITEWLLVDVTGHRRSFVPALEAADADGRVRVPFTRDQVVGAPQVGDDEELAKRDEMELYSHYGVDYTAAESGSVLPTDATVEGAQAPAAGSPTAAGTSTRLRRVTQSPMAAQPAAGSSGSGGAASAALPVAGVAGLVAAVWLALRALQRRSKRRPSAAERAERLRKRAGKGSAKATKNARKTAKKQAALLSTAAARTSRSASAASGTAAKKTSTYAARAASTLNETAGRGTLALAGGLAAAGDAVSRAGHEAGQSVGALSAKASKAAAGNAAAASKAAAKASRKATKARKKADKKRRKTARSLAAVPQAVERSGKRFGRRSSSSLSAVPRRTERRAKKIAKRGRRARRTVARNLWQLVLATAAGAGYVLGARAGHERYEEITDVASAVASRPEVQAATATVTDPQKRQQALAALRDRAAALRGR